MPTFVDPIRFKSGSTDILFGSTAGLVGGYGTPPSTSAYTIAGTTTTQDLYNKTLYGAFAPVENVAYSTLLTSTMCNYGVSIMTHSTVSSGPMVVTMAAPVVGCEKTIVLAASTAASSNYWKVILGASTAVTLIDSAGLSTSRAIRFDSSTILGIQAVALRGVSTATWLLMQNYSTAVTASAT